MSSSSHLSWKSPNPEGTLSAALGKLNRQFQELTSQEWNPKTATIGGIRDVKLSCFAPDKAGWSFLMLHLYSQLGDPLAQELSNSMAGPAIVFYEYDQAAWGFAVYEKGTFLGRFWDRPEVVEEDPKDCVVGPELLAELFGVEADAVAPYLKQFDPDEDDPGRAHPDDEFSLGDHWVRCDLMRRLGLRYVSPSEPGARHVLIKEPGVN